MLSLCKKSSKLSVESKTGVLEIFGLFLQDLNKFLAKSTKYDFGQYLNLLKIDSYEYLYLASDPSLEVWKQCFKVFKEAY